MSCDEEYDFTLGDELADITLVVQDKELHVHKAILATASPVFKRMFTSDFREKHSNKIPLPDKQYAHILTMLTVMYPNFSIDFDKIDLAPLLELAEEYGMIKVKRSIETHLIKNLKMSTEKLYGKRIEETVSYLMDLVRLSTDYRFKSLEAEVIEFTVSKINRESLEKNNYYLLSLEPTVKNEILTKKLVSAEERLTEKEKVVKQMQDDLLKQRFELQRLHNRLKEQE